jgi:hypothetical protein
MQADNITASFLACVPCRLSIPVSEGITQLTPSCALKLSHAHVSRYYWDHHLNENLQDPSFVKPHSSRLSSMYQSCRPLSNKSSQN